MSPDRLANLHLLPPGLSAAWATQTLRSAARTLRRRDGHAVSIESPLFWYEPAWVQLPAEIADRLACAVADLDVLVSALARDLAEHDEAPTLFQPVEGQASNSAAQRPRPPEPVLPRITPYRVERYGLTPMDFERTRIVDVRLCPWPDESGRLAYSPERMQRWERPAEDTPIAGGGYVACGSFPTDVVSLSQAAVKLDQLRRLASDAAVFVSIGPYRLKEEIAAALVAAPDGIILRLDAPEFEAIQLAALVHRARSLLVDQGRPELPLWVVPGPVSPSDVAKLMALGASAVAIDAWCNPLIETLAESLNTSRYDRVLMHKIPAIASTQLWHAIDQVLGSLSSFAAETPAHERLGTYHPRWAQACGAALLSV